MTEASSIPASDRPELRQWQAVCAKGTEGLLADEIRQLGGSVIKEPPMGVVWEGSLETAYRVCLWSRLANRMMLPLVGDKVDNVEEVYEVARRVNWPEIFPASATFRIDFHGRTDFIRNTQFGAQKVKDGVVDSFRAATGSRPDVDKSGDIRIEAQIR